MLDLATASRHFQVIWLLERGHTISQVSEATAFGERWIEQLLARYNAEGPEAPGDLRRRNGASATILKPDLLANLRVRLDEAPPDGGLWSSQPGWLANSASSRSRHSGAGGRSIQKPRPKKSEIGHARRSGAFKKSSRTLLPWRPRSTEASHGNRRLGPMAQSCAAAFLAGIRDPDEIVYNSRRYSR
jgi:hypothetical protein